MKIYFLLEGQRTEAKIYPAWLSYLLPKLKRMKFHNEKLEDNSYFLFSANGYPSIIYNHLPNAIEDINTEGGFDYLVVSLDADESSVQERIDEVNKLLAEKNIVLKKTEIVLIIQNRCIETWLLGNSRIVKQNPINQELIEFKQFYNVISDNPEEMGKHSDFNTHSQFHFEYLREVFRERNLSYSKANPSEATKETYLIQLINRVEKIPNHLQTFQKFLEFCEDVKKQIR
jgi:hypothetical protein